MLVMKEIVNCAAYAEGKRITDVQLSDVHDVLMKKNQFVWIGLHEPSETILETVQKEFNLHELAVEDAHTAHQRPAPAHSQQSGQCLFQLGRDQTCHRV